MGECVRRERPPDLEDARVVPEAPDVVLDRHPKIVPGGRGEVPEVSGEHLDDATEIDRLVHDRQLPGVDA